jgi:TonB family protein
MPTVIRYLWPQIVVPRWVLCWDEEAQRRLIAHEEQHERAGDPWLLLGGAAALVLMPWNLLLWWQVRRLRLAIEVDCDARVLREMPGTRAYGLLLLAVGERVSRARALTVAFSEPCSLLERRIRILTQSLTRPGRPALTVLCTAAALAPLCIAALPVPELPRLDRILDARAPASPSVGSGSNGMLQPSLAGSAISPGDVGRAVLDAIRVPVSVAEPARLEGERMAIWTTRRNAPPAVGPYGVAPRLINQDELTRRAARANTSGLRNQGWAGAVVLWAHVDALGRVVDVRIARGSGSEALDRVALEALWWADFVPAQYQGQGVDAWVEVPITFGPRAGAVDPQR